MGFFSGLIGTSSEWDGASYVAKLTGSKFWHSNFIDKDAMRQAGIDFAFEATPIDASPRMPQSPKTIPGELIYLLEVCEYQGDSAGARKVARAMFDLLQNHSNKVWEFTEMKFQLTNYQDYLGSNGSQNHGHKTSFPSERTKHIIFREVVSLIERYVKTNTLGEFSKGYIVLDDKYALDDFISVSFSATSDLTTNIYSLVKTSNLKSLVLLEDAMDMKPTILNDAIYMIGREVIEKFEMDSPEFRSLKTP